MRRRTSAPSRKSDNAELVLAVFTVLLQQTFRDQRDREPMDGALRQPEAPRERADADFDLVFRKRLEQPNRGRDRGQPLAPSPPVGVADFPSRHPLLAVGAPEAWTRPRSAPRTIVPRHLGAVSRTCQ